MGKGVHFDDAGWLMQEVREQYGLREPDDQAARRSREGGNPISQHSAISYF
jgi:hypothetical protein